MDIATLMLIGYRAMDERVIRAMREAGYDVTVAQARIAQRIARGGSRLTDLAEQAQVTKQTASVLVAALEQQGFVERAPDPDDARAVRVLLSREGERVLARLSALHREELRRMDAALAPPSWHTTDDPPTAREAGTP